MKLSKRQLKRIIREEKNKILSEMGMGAAYSGLRDMEPDPSEIASKKTLSTVARNHLNYLHGFMSEVERLESTDPRAEDISELYFQLIERMSAVLEMRESKHSRVDTSQGGIYGGGPEDEHFGSWEEEVYYDAQRAVEEDMAAGGPNLERRYSEKQEAEALFQEFYSDLVDEWHEMDSAEQYDHKGNPLHDEEEYYDDEVDPERNYISGDSIPEPEYYNPAWGDSREDYID